MKATLSAYTPILAPDQIAALSSQLTGALKNDEIKLLQPILRAFIYKIVVKKDKDKNIVGNIIYYTPVPTGSPPFAIRL